MREKTDLPVLLQGEDTAGALTHRFASDARTCLFGTRSFWQGIDVVGSACQLVILDRIPFPHVDDPLMKARLAAAGDHGFMDVTLPPAAVLLAQGAGRLIRSTTDRGVVVVLDPRLATARYGEVLLQDAAAASTGRSPWTPCWRRCGRSTPPPTRSGRSGRAGRRHREIARGGSDRGRSSRVVSRRSG